METADKTGTQSDSPSLTTKCCCRKHMKASIHFGSFAAHTILKGSKLQKLMRSCIKSFFEVQDECVDLSASVQDFSPIVYLCDLMNFTAMFFSKTQVAYQIQVHVALDEPTSCSRGMQSMHTRYTEQ